MVTSLRPMPDTVRYWLSFSLRDWCQH